MFSSLPGASKIYVGSTKSRQKSASSVKRKRKKLPLNPNNENSPDETLISIANGSEHSFESPSESVLQLHFTESSKLDWEKDGSSSELSLPTVKSIGQHSQVSSTMCKNKNKESPIKTNGEKCCIDKSEPVVFDEPVVSDESKSDKCEGTFITSDEKEETTLLIEEEDGISHCRKDSLLSPIKSKNNVINESANELPSVERMEEQPTENKVDLNGSHSEIESKNEDINLCTNEYSRCENLENIVAVSPQQDSERVIVNSANDDVLNDSNCTDVNANVQENSSQSSCFLNENKEIDTTHEQSQNLNENLCGNNDNIPIPANSLLNENLNEEGTENFLQVSKDSHVNESESLHKNLTIERIQSPEPSEISCTESLMNESRICQSDIVPTNLSESKSSVGFSDFSFVSEEKLYNRDNSYVCQSYSDLGRGKCNSFSLQRFPSWPSSLDHGKNFYKSPFSKVTSFSDKATFTVDLLPEKCDKESSSDDMSLISREDSVDSKKEHKSISTTFQEIVSPHIAPPLAMLQARSRSYVFGSMGPKGSLLGSDELNRLFPDGQVTVFIGTWNMNSQNPPKCIDDFLLPLDINTLPDIYAIGIQEGSQSRFEWEVLLQTTLGPSHVLFTSSSLGVLHLSIFLRRDLIWFCSEPEEASVATRPGTMVKTKGAVAVCFMFFGTSFLFVNSHLTAHEQKLKERLSDYEKICSSLDLPKLIPLKTNNRNKDVTSRFDCVFWCGDLNFRVIRDRPSVLSFVDKKPRTSCSFLIKHDQLHKAMADGAAFHGFKEGVINFIPSYKFDVGTCKFAESKLRVPSYTDRILFRYKEGKSSISCLHYDAAPDISTSDHKPVFAVFKVSVKPGRDNVPLAGGMFKRDIYLEAIKRRARFLEVQRNQGQSAVCNVM